MNWSKIENDQVTPLSMFDISKNENLREAICWKNTQPILKKDHQHKSTKYVFLEYQLQFIKAYQLLKLTEEGHN